jgi:hypothetical protein
LHGGDRVHGVRATQRASRYLAQADGADFSDAHQIGERTDAVLDRHRLVPAVQVVQVDDLGAQAAQALVAGASQRCRPAVDHALALDARHAAFARQYEF